MCGVAAVFDRQGGRVDVSALKKMTWAIRHRGPNDEGHILFNTATEAKSALDPSRPEGRAAHWDLGLGNRRLSILDLSPAAHQPMGSADGKIWLTYNGEIYNYVELRDELRARGHVFSTTSDTEVVLRAYEEYGADCVQRFNGMWAFILWDGNAQVLFCSRDRFGEKPLYFLFLAIIKSFTELTIGSLFFVNMMLLTFSLFLMSNVLQPRNKKIFVLLAK